MLALTAVCSLRSRYDRSAAHTVFISDVGGGSVKNDERHSLARIPLRWMIRECFKVNTGIIFNGHMLKHEVGLDIDGDIGPTFTIPKPLSPGPLHLRRPSGAELEGFSFRRILVGLGSPFQWAEGKLLSLRLHDSKKLERRGPVSLGEPREELNDALSPIVDQIKVNPGWKIVEWIPCKFSPPTRLHQRRCAHTPSKGP